MKGFIEQSQWGLKAILLDTVCLYSQKQLMRTTGPEELCVEKNFV